MVTVTPGSAPPLASCTTPEMVPGWAGCASAGSAMAAMSAAVRTSVDSLNMVASPETDAETPEVTGLQSNPVYRHFIPVFAHQAPGEGTNGGGVIVAARAG